MRKKSIYLISFACVFLTTGRLSASTDPCATGNATAKIVDIRINGKKAFDFSTVTPGSEVTVKFNVTGTEATEFSLVSYRTPEANESMTQQLASQMQVYQKATRKASSGQLTLTVLVPDCYFRLYFVKGCVLEKYNAASNNTYEYWNRVLLVTSGGMHSCKKKEPKKITICHFPPGNPSNQHTIEVSENSWDAHQDHGDFLGECRDTIPPDTSDCPCDYDLDGLVDRIYGSLMTSVDSAYAIHFSGGSDTAILMAQNSLIMDVLVHYEDGATQTFSGLNTPTFVVVTSAYDIMAVEVNGNLIENLHKLDPDILCDCYPDSGEPVPVKLTYFTGEKLASSIVKLSWQTASEENNDYFLVRRTVNMKDWKEVCRVIGAGNSKDLKDYSCMDNNAGEEGQNLAYYQLKQVDLNGTYEYSDLIRIRLQNAAYAATVGNAYPNPTADRVYITYNAAENGLFSLRLLSLEGKLLRTTSFVALAGEQIADLDLGENSLKPGIYILEIRSDNEIFRQKVYKR